MGNITVLHKRNDRALTVGSVAPAKEEVVDNTVGEHDAQPIKSAKDIQMIKMFLLRNKRYRDHMLFIVGINFGLRVSDLTVLRLSHLLQECEGGVEFRETFQILEKKTANTRKAKRNRHIAINDSVMEAVSLYIEHTPGLSLSDYLFRSESNNGGASNKPLNRKSVDRILKGIGEDLNIPCRLATHSLRKTFGYHQMLMSGNDPRKLLILQKMFGHSTTTMTLEYIGITGEELVDAYMKLNLGNSSIVYELGEIKEIGA